MTESTDHVQVPSLRADGTPDQKDGFVTLSENIPDRQIPGGDVVKGEQATAAPKAEKRVAPKKAAAPKVDPEA